MGLNMGILTGTLLDTVTYWSRSGVNDEGHGSYNTPATMTARWVNTQTILRDLNGEEISSEVIVYCNVVLNVGDWVYLGSSASSTPPDSAHEIKQKAVRRDLAGNETVYRYFL